MSPHFSGAQRHFAVRGRTVNPRSHSSVGRDPGAWTSTDASIGVPGRLVHLPQDAVGESD